VSTGLPRLVLLAASVSCVGASGIRPDGADDVSRTGGLAKEQLRAVFERHMDELQGCYEAELRRKPKLAGTVTLHVVINRWGDAEVAKLASSTLHSFSAEECMLDRVREWRFPEPIGGGQVEVTYPAVFAPSR
jgi:hypothetical protein